MDVIHPKQRVDKQRKQMYNRDRKKRKEVQSMFEMMGIYNDGAYRVYELSMMEVVTRIKAFKAQDDAYAIIVRRKRTVVYEWSAHA